MRRAPPPAIAGGAALVALLASCSAPQGAAPVQPVRGALPATTRSAPAATTNPAPALAALRRSAGLAPLRRDARLDAAAAQQSRWMRRSGRMGHVGQGGSGPMQRVRGAGLLACFAAENVAEGYDGLGAVLRGWMTSPGHRANILDPRAGLFGIAREGDYWTLLTAAPCPPGAVLAPTR